MKSREVTHLPALIETALKSDACYIAMVDDDQMPYVVPMNFGISNESIYLHSARTGKKITILRKRPQVCVCFSTDHQLRWQSEKVACSYSMKYRSVLAHGRVEFIEDHDEKMKALNTIMQHYTGRDFSYNLPAINEVMVYRVVVRKWEGRSYRY
ncbi:MAG: pyridoxamine 5'-phosphate oxidase family protein [Sphingobacteriia bacterium]|nr:pyridoxamine 5'-phosphate oxidase family protein [Sphingobacteriia bacterium]